MDPIPIFLEGNLARVTVGEGTIEMRPKNQHDPEEKQLLQRKIAKLENFRLLTIGIDGLAVPKVLERDEINGRYVIQKAEGFNLSSLKEQTFGDPRAFFEIPVEAKVKGLLTYLRAIERINSRGFAFADHKSDSVFITPEGIVTIVDTDGLREDQSPWNIDRDPDNGLQDLCNNFFIRQLGSSALGTDYEDRIPAFIRRLIPNLQETDTVGDVIEEMDKVMTDWGRPLETGKTTTYSYHVRKAKEATGKALNSESFAYYLKLRL